MPGYRYAINTVINRVDVCDGDELILQPPFDVVGRLVALALDEWHTPFVFGLVPDERRREMAECLTVARDELIDRGLIAG